MITLAILDDDPQSLSSLHSLVNQQLPEDLSFQVFPTSSQDELEALLKRGIQIDILITDVIMPEGQPSGIDVVQSLFPPECGTQIIYTSGFMEQALEVYATKHVYFLLKPIEPQKLSDALYKAIEALPRHAPSMLRIKTGYKERLINTSTITYIESRLHKATVYTHAAAYETYAKLDDIQQELPSSFTRCHRSYLVNLAFIISLNETDLVLHDGTTIPISRRHVKQVQRDMLGYLSRRQ